MSQKISLAKLGILQRHFRLLLATQVFLVLAIGSVAQACTPSYVVKHGDTLSRIAAHQLGSIFAFERIYETNQKVIGPNPNLIQVGTELTIPCAAGGVGELDWTVMPSAETLARLSQTEDIQVLDIRNSKSVAKGVVAGSISIPYAMWSGPKENPGLPPSPERLANLIGYAGLDLNKPTIIVHGKPNTMNVGRAAKVYWLLKSAGAETLAILRGGYTGWTNAELPVAIAPVRPKPIQTEITFSTKWRADEVDVYGIATGQVDGYLLDARPHKFFSRLSAAGTAIASTLPGAQSTPVQPLMKVLSGEVDVEQGAKEVIAYLKNHNIDWTQKEVVSFCQSGELAALNWFYASELAALDNMRLYPESVKGWKEKGGKLVIGDTG